MFFDGSFFLAKAFWTTCFTTLHKNGYKEGRKLVIFILHHLAPFLFCLLVGVLMVFLAIFPGPPLPCFPPLAANGLAAFFNPFLVGPCQTQYITVSGRDFSYLLGYHTFFS